jgi:hypothetical protein
MRVPNQFYQRGLSYTQLEGWERSRRLSVVRERVRQISQELFDLSCQLQKRFNVDDVKHALALVAEMNSLKAHEQMLRESS